MTDPRRGYQIPDDILDDLCTRFILDLRSYQLQDHRTLVFAVEQAHWFYEDNYVSPPDDEDDDEVEHYDVKSVTISNFIRQVYHHCPQLREAAPDVDAIIQDWHKLKSVIPSYGAIILDQSLTKVVLVQSYSQKANWGFPKGKRNEKEAETKAAAREVREETGFDIGPNMHPDSFLEYNFGGKLVRLYIVPNVPESTTFNPRTRGEIRDIQWFDIEHLPQTKRDPAPRHHLGLSPNSFFMVYPFVLGLRRWIERFRRLEEARQSETPKRSFAQSSLGEMSDLLALVGKAPPPMPQEADPNAFKVSMKMASQWLEQQQLPTQPDHRHQQQYEQHQPQQQATAKQHQPGAAKQSSQSTPGKQKQQKKRPKSRGVVAIQQTSEKQTAAGKTVEKQPPVKSKKQRKKEKSGENVHGTEREATNFNDNFPTLRSLTWERFSLDFSQVMAVLPLNN